MVLFSHLRSFRPQTTVPAHRCRYHSTKEGGLTRGSKHIVEQIERTNRVDHKFPSRDFNPFYVRSDILSQHISTITVNQTDGTVGNTHVPAEHIAERGARASHLIASLLDLAHPELQGRRITGAAEASEQNPQQKRKNTGPQGVGP